MGLALETRSVREHASGAVDGAQQASTCRLRWPPLNVVIVPACNVPISRARSARRRSFGDGYQFSSAGWVIAAPRISSSAFRLQMPRYVFYTRGSVWIRLGAFSSFLPWSSTMTDDKYW